MDWMEEVKNRIKRKNQILFGKDCLLLDALGQKISQTHRCAQVLWALEQADALARTLSEVYPAEERPMAAVAAARSWAAGELKMRPAQRAILDCHAVARDLREPRDIALCHAVGQGCAVVHTSGHALGLPMYALTALVWELGVENCREAVEMRLLAYLERLDDWEKHWREQPGPWAEFLTREKD